MVPPVTESPFVSPPVVEPPKEQPVSPPLVSATEQQLRDRDVKQMRGRGLSTAQTEAITLRLVSSTCHPASAQVLQLLTLVSHSQISLIFFPSFSFLSLTDLQHFRSRGVGQW